MFDPPTQEHPSNSGPRAMNPGLQMDVVTTPRPPAMMFSRMSIEGCALPEHSDIQEPTKCPVYSPGACLG